MRKVSILLVLAAVLMSCQSLPPIATIQGPGVVQYMVQTGVRWALSEKDATSEEALKIRGYLLEGRAMLDGDVPAAALDELAEFLNTKIENPLVRRAVQQGAQFVKANITIPDDIIPDDVKVWFYAVLDGAATGCAEYAAMGIGPGAVPFLTAPSVISFR